MYKYLFDINITQHQSQLTVQEIKSEKIMLGGKMQKIDIP